MHLLHRFLRFGRTLLAFAAPVLLAAGFFLGYRTGVFVKHAIHAQATISQMEARNTGDPANPEYYPHFEFTAADGSPHTIISSVGTNPPQYSVGDTTDVLYDSADPNDARLNSVTQLWFTTAVVSSLGVITLIASALVFRMERKVKRRLITSRSGLPASQPPTQAAIG